MSQACGSREMQVLDEVVKDKVGRFDEKIVFDTSEVHSDQPDDPDEGTSSENEEYEKRSKKQVEG